jgi:hypothetical protein
LLAPSVRQYRDAKQDLGLAHCRRKQIARIVAEKPGMYGRRRTNFHLLRKDVGIDDNHHGLLEPWRFTDWLARRQDQFDATKRLDDGADCVAKISSHGIAFGVGERGAQDVEGFGLDGMSMLRGAHPEPLPRIVIQIWYGDRIHLGW